MHFREIKLSVIFYKEGNKFIAYSPALDLSTSANTFEKAKKRFEEITDIFFNELVKMGTLEDVLIECGWKKARRPKSHWIPPHFITQTEEVFQIPCPA